MSKILKKLHCFATFCLTQTQNLPVEPVLGGEKQIFLIVSKLEKIFQQFSLIPL